MYEYCGQNWAAGEVRATTPTVRLVHCEFDLAIVMRARHDLSECVLFAYACVLVC